MTLDEAAADWVGDDLNLERKQEIEAFKAGAIWAEKHHDDKIMQTHKDAFEKLADDSRPPPEQWTFRIDKLYDCSFRVTPVLDCDVETLVLKSAYDQLAKELSEAKAEIEERKEQVAACHDHAPMSGGEYYNNCSACKLLKQLTEALAEIDHLKRQHADEHSGDCDIPLVKHLRWECKSRDALIERCEKALKRIHKIAMLGTNAGSIDVSRACTNVLTEIAAFKKAEK